MNFGIELILDVKMGIELFLYWHAGIILVARIADKVLWRTGLWSAIRQTWLIVIGQIFIIGNLDKF